MCEERWVKAGGLGRSLCTATMTLAQKLFTSARFNSRLYAYALELRNFAARSRIPIEFFALQRNLISWRFGAAALMGVSSLNLSAAPAWRGLFF